MQIVVDLAATGPLNLGTYTTAQVLAVNGPSPGLPAVEPLVLAEAVRSLVAIGMAVRVEGSDELDVQGDLGVVRTIQKRSRLVVGAVFRGGRDKSPWHLVLLPQPEGVTLLGEVDALGLHQFTAVQTAAARKRLEDALPEGKAAEPDDGVPVAEQVERADESASVSVVSFSESGAEATVQLLALRAGVSLRVLQHSGDRDWRDLKVDRVGMLKVVDDLVGPALTMPKPPFPAGRALT